MLGKTSSSAGVETLEEPTCVAVKSSMGTGYPELRMIVETSSPKGGSAALRVLGKKSSSAAV